ncbi:MAG: ribosome biogenesis GTPase Der, partial [Candidatus Omnitrophica bacterium]|nr:ribosome biogenesis GTPase Der [Candidatus Omnitrophota bacterium]
MTDTALPKIAIVGRPNVGKSSLFNRIIGTRSAIVESASGTTRDRLYAEIKRKKKRFTLIDTGGFETSKSHNEITPLILKQLDQAIKEADIIFFVTDGSFGLSHQDAELASRLRKTSKKIYLIVNKVDDRSQHAKALAFFELGLGEPYSVSALNGIGIEKLLDDVLKSMEESGVSGGLKPIKVAIVGRPNVGKSSYLNALLNEERSIVHPVAGTTRDAIDTDLDYKGALYRLIDTAGMRHNMKLDTAADFYGSVRSKEAIKRADVAIVIIDGMDGLREDDERILEFCVKEGRAVVVAVNKWDLVKTVEKSKYKEMLISRMAAIKNFPVIFTSCKTKTNILSSLDLIRPLYEKTGKMFGPEELKDMLGALNDSPEVR